MENETTEVANTSAATIEAATEPNIESAVSEAVNDVIAAEASERAADAGETVAVSEPERTEDKGQPTEKVGEGEGEHRNEKPSVEAPVDYSKEQELFERAVRAGIAVKDVLAIPTYDMAERMVEMAEKSNGISKTPDKGNEDAGAGTPADDLGAALEEMEKDGEYDPKIVKLLKGLYKENQALKSAGHTAEQQSFFEQQFGSLDDALRSKVDAVHKSKLKSKYDLLEAGYRAQGSHIRQEDVFQEAARLALGDLMGKVAEERKAAALEQRKNLTLARPGSDNGQKRRNGPATDEDIASEIWEMMG